MAIALNCSYRKCYVDPNSTAESEGLASSKGDDALTISQTVKQLWSKLSVTQNMNVNVNDRNGKFSATANGDAAFVACNCVGNSVNRVLQRDLDILKLDVSVLESRLPSAISQNHSIGTEYNYTEDYLKRKTI